MVIRNTLSKIGKKLEQVALKLISKERPCLPIQLDITNACNLRCKHCYHNNHDQSGTLSLSQWQNIIAQYKTLIEELHCSPHFTICGGEPLISPIFFDILKVIESNFPGTPVQILTNGTLVSAEVLSQLAGVGLSITFQVSIDGPDPLRHDMYRGSGNFDRAVRGIQLLKKNRYDVTLLAILSKTTSLWISDFFTLAKELQVEAMNFTRFIPTGKGLHLVSNASDGMLAPHELKEAYKKILLTSTELGVKTVTHAPLMVLLHPKLGGYGHFGKGIIIDYKGNLKVSSRANYVVGSVLNEELKPLYLTNPILSALRQGKIAGCAGCSYVKVCGGDRNVAYASYGDFLARDPQCWFKSINLDKKNKGDALCTAM